MLSSDSNTVILFDLGGWTNIHTAIFKLIFTHFHIDILVIYELWDVCFAIFQFLGIYFAFFQGYLFWQNFWKTVKLFLCAN